jgi:hypothetical protein
MRLFEAEFYGGLDILPTHGKAGASARATPGTKPGTKQRLKKVAEATRATPGTEEVAKVTEINASAFPARRWGKIGPCLPMLAELVIALALLWIGEHCIGLPDLLELLLRALVARVDVRVILARQLAIGFLDVVRSRGASNS